MYIPKQLFPTEINSSSLPGPYCLDSTLDVNASCPFAGYDELLRIFSIPDSAQDNLTITNPTTLNRRMALNLQFLTPLSTLNGKFVSQAQCWTQSHVLANYLSLGWQSRVSDDPFTIQINVEGRTGLLSPYVNVSCEMAPHTAYNRNMSFFSNPMGGPEYEHLSRTGTFDIRRIWNETVLTKSSRTMIAWKEFFEQTDNPVLAAFILSPNGSASANVTMCGVEARWESVDMWFMSNGAGTVSSNFTWDILSDMKLWGLPVANVRKEWADALNAVSQNSSTVLADLVDGAIETSKDQATSTGSMVGTITKILSMAVADGISRIGAEHNVNTGVSGGIHSNVSNATVSQFSSFVRLLLLLR